MSHSAWDLSVCVERLQTFRRDRDWERFHTPKELAAALAIEAGELQETLLWKSEAEVTAMLADPTSRARFEEELADVAIYLLLAAERAGVDLRASIEMKISANEIRYPVEEHKGIARKSAR